MKYLGMKSETGERLGDLSHIKQSIQDIFTTPVGSRVARREYGSLLFKLIDSPQNSALKLRIMSAAYTAILHWEPRIVIQKLTVNVSGKAQVYIDLEGVYIESQSSFQLSIPVR